MLKSYYDYFIRNGKLIPSNDFNPDIFCEGTSIYEVVRLIDKVPLFLDEHLERFRGSAFEMDKKISINTRQIKNHIKQLAESNKVSNGNVEIILNYCGDDVHETNVILLFIEQRYPSEQDYKYGVGAGIFQSIREKPHVKQINLDLRKNTSRKISENGFYEVILLKKDGEITEGSRSNVYFIRNKEIITPPMDIVLPGITRQKVFELCKEFQINIKEERIFKQELPDYNAAFLSGTSPKILPLRFVDHCKFDIENQTLRKIMQLYDQLINEYVKENSRLLA